MTDTAAQSWDHVDIPCSLLHPAEGEPAQTIVPTAETQAAVREMLKEHFPEGPGSAIESHKAYCEWQSANASVFFKAEKDRPQIADVGKRWRGFVNSWHNYASSQQWMLGRVHARPELGRGLNLNQAQTMQRSSWRERRNNGRDGGANTRTRER